jgi:hypothetical protein
MEINMVILKFIPIFIVINIAPLLFSVKKNKEL